MDVMNAGTSPTTTNSNESNAERAAELRAMGYPKRIQVASWNKHAEGWKHFFERQYIEECERLGIPAALSLFNGT